MNGKVEELVKQATILEDHNLFVREVFNKEKFAELIIEECINAVSRTDRRHAYTTFDAGMIDGTIEKSIKSIKETFGMLT